VVDSGGGDRLGSVAVADGVGAVGARLNWTVDPADRRCLVAVACNERTIHRETAASLAALGWGSRVADAAAAHGFASIEFRWFSAAVRVDTLRNQACAAAIADGFSHLLFLDADMSWPADVLARMLAHHARGVVSALYFLKRWPHYPVALRDGVRDESGATRYHYDLRGVDADGLRRESVVGMGCTLIPVAALRRMARPWFAYGGDGSITEDVAFCESASALGCGVWLDPAIECGHYSVQEISRAWFDRSMVERELIAQARGSA
jgi:hypothetical protein